jgi:hypothetical protein
MSRRQRLSGKLKGSVRDVQDWFKNHTSHPGSPTTSTLSPGATSSGRGSEGTKNKTTLEALAAFRALLNVAEKALDGLPTWGPKAAVGASAEVLKIIQVRVPDRRLCLDSSDPAPSQLKLENDDAVDNSRKDVKDLESALSATEADVPAELKERAEQFKRYALFRLASLRRFISTVP